ncbi:unnamed protein product, partial [Pylaiella littoralis]
GGERKRGRRVGSGRGRGRHKRRGRRVGGGRWVHSVGARGGERQEEFEMKEGGGAGDRAKGAVATEERKGGVREDEAGGKTEIDTGVDGDGECDDEGRMEE